MLPLLERVDLNLNNSELQCLRSGEATTTANNSVRDTF